MAKELSEDTGVTVSIKTLGGIAALIATISAGQTEANTKVLKNNVIVIITHVVKGTFLFHNFIILTHCVYFVV